MDKTLRIGWIGLGNMGVRMAPNLAAAGFLVTGFDTDQRRMEDVAAQGVAIAASPQALAASSDVLFLMIPDDSVFLQVVRATYASMPKGACLIDMSTLSPDASAEAAGLLEEAGVTYLRAPVSGSTGLAEQGTLSILVSGPRDVFAAHLPLLEKLGRKIAYLGAGEEARVAKLVVNTIIGATNNALAEALNLGHRSGLDWETMIDVIAGSAVASPYIASKVDKLKARDWSVAAPVSLVAKDMDLALDLAKKNGAHMPLAAIVRQMLVAKAGRGEQDQDMASLVTIYE